MNERVLRFGDGLIGIYTPSAARGERPGFVLVNAGMVHRSGPNRLYVNIARQLAAAGYPVLRFDLSAIGDSIPRNDALVFEKSSISETSAAMAALGKHSGATGFVVGGICSGADVSFLTTRDNPAVIGAVLINGRGLHGVTDDTGDTIEAAVDAGASTRYLLQKSLFNPSSWMKLVSGEVNYREMLRLLAGKIVPQHDRTPDAAPGLRAAFHAVLERGTELLLVYSAGDPAIDYMKLMFGKEMKKIVAYRNYCEIDMPHADHTFTPRSSRENLIAALRNWADARFAR
jgi:pimeloyl-ACP methyl ester carboxylesterase